jgi:hypothetical protein
MKSKNANGLFEKSLYLTKLIFLNEIKEFKISIFIYDLKI